jgi:hypothetical protein
MRQKCKNSILKQTFLTSFDMTPSHTRKPSDLVQFCNSLSNPIYITINLKSSIVQKTVKTPHPTTRTLAVIKQSMAAT